MQKARHRDANSSNSRIDRDSLDTLIEWTKLVLPELDDIQASADLHSGTYAVTLSIGAGSTAIKIPLQSASDGTIKWLAFASMILVQGPNYSIEEPENFLHPTMQRFFVNLLRDHTGISKRTDFSLISTHSETIINQLSPRELVVFEFSDGKTGCRRLSNPDAVTEQINETGFGLGYYFAANAVS